MIAYRALDEANARPDVKADVVKEISTLLDSIQSYSDKNNTEQVHKTQNKIDRLMDFVQVLHEETRKPITINEEVMKKNAGFLFEFIKEIERE